MFLKINWSILLRKKLYTNENVAETNLLRVLGLLDICAIGKYKIRKLNESFYSSKSNLKPILDVVVEGFFK
jgi:hypothetical protein